MIFFVGVSVVVKLGLICVVEKWEWIGLISTPLLLLLKVLCLRREHYLCHIWKRAAAAAAEYFKEVFCPAETEHRR